jgi:hypothetical protein
LFPIIHTTYCNLKRIFDHYVALSAMGTFTSVILRLLRMYHVSESKVYMGSRMIVVTFKEMDVFIS